MSMMGLSEENYYASLAFVKFRAENINSNQIHAIDLWKTL